MDLNVGAKDETLNGGMGQYLRNLRYAVKFRGHATRARPPRMGAFQGERLTGMPELSQLRLHGLHATERPRPEHAFDLPGKQGKDLHRLPQGHCAQAPPHPAGSGAYRYSRADRTEGRRQSAGTVDQQRGQIASR